MSARGPLADTRPSATHSWNDTRPLTSCRKVSGAHSTTFGGVPRVCLGPAMHWTAAYGGTRTSTLFPGAAAASSAIAARTASRIRPGRGSSWESKASTASRITASVSVFDTPLTIISPRYTPVPPRQERQLYDRIDICAIMTWIAIANPPLPRWAQRLSRGSTKAPRQYVPAAAQLPVHVYSIPNSL